MTVSTEGKPAEGERDPAAAEAPPDPKRWAALGIVLLAAFMDLLDVTIVNVAIPSIQRDIGAGYAAVSWITAGYALAFAALLITCGRLGDIYGRRKMLLWGIATFTITSVLCGVASDPGMLITARILQGASAALMIPQVLSIIHVTFPASERGKVFGMYGAVGGLAVVSGPVLGGLFVEADLFGLAWRPIFLVNIPVGILGFIGALYLVRESRDTKASRVDPIGVLLATSAVLLLVYPLIQGRENDWPVWGFVMMAGSLLVLAAFIAHQRSVMARGGSPLVALNLFRARSFAGGFSVNLLTNVTNGAFFLMWTLYMQIGLGWSAIHAGLTGLAFFIGLALAAGMAVEYLTPKFGRKVLFAGGLLMMAGATLFVFVSDRYGPDITSWQMAPPLFIMGLGMGYIVAPVLDFALTEVPHSVAGSASGVLNTTQQLGNAVGIALVSVLFLAALPGQSDKGVDYVADDIRQELTTAGVPDPVQDQILAGYRVCVHDRMEEKDSTVVPESCRTEPPAEVPAAAAAEIERVLTEHGADAQAETFSRAYRVGLMWVLGVMAVMTLLMVSLPRFATPQQH
ncbi:MFS transporter [Streptomyces aidingensis]|uniref:Drug resistance transporter, EmrB/QacA subfamily n=1 Tax=Streptomyces aidingensis TaxID=910347 RepID=A0A1I1FHY8_9ACTN|nr:MFS transporter [Streptomyces aidingensis]SFB98592.1 drug resistance transporter, EmrB/QacA subfamily [Streptomyces aidingensis]